MHLEAPQAPPRLWRISRKGAGGERDGTDDPVHDDKSFTGERIPTVKRRRANKTWGRGREGSSRSQKSGDVLNPAYVARYIFQQVSRSSGFENRAKGFDTFS